MNTPHPLHELIDPGWALALAPVEEHIHRMGDMLRAEKKAGRAFLPAGKNILKAFTYPFEDVKVLIVGQDPYPTPGHAIGLSFSVAPGVALPRSLANIYTELVNDCALPYPSSGDLTPWAKQGVCLLNRVLSVQAGEAGSHRGRGWEDITDCAIEALVRRNKPLVAILWGRDAQTLRPRLQGIPTLESAHPSPLSARRGFFGSRPFSRANALLEAAGSTPINWRLP